MKRTDFFKRAVYVLFFVIISAALNAQDVKDTTYWKTTGLTSLNFGQVSLSHWAGGGNSSVSGIGNFDYNAVYQKDRIQWDNLFKAGYGLLKESDREVVKSEDRLELNSKLGVKLNIEKLLYSSFINFQTQFAPGYKYPNTADKISDFMAPAYLTLATGLDYQPSESFSFFITPLSGKFTFVMDDVLSDAGAFGVDPGNRFRAELGAIFKALYKTALFTNVDLATGLTLFSNYFNEPKNIDVDWDATLNMKINKYMAASFGTILKYDHDILIPIDDEGTMGRRVQLKQILGVGFSYKF